MGIQLGMQYKKLKTGLVIIGHPRDCQTNTNRPMARKPITIENFVT